jgi:hypothetical protein
MMVQPISMCIAGDVLILEVKNVGNIDAKVIVCGWANGHDRGNWPFSQRCEHSETARCNSSRVVREGRAHGSFVVGTTGCI